MTNKIIERWGEDFEKVFPESARPSQLSHFQTEELFFFSSTGISVAGAAEALNEQLAERRARKPTASAWITGDMIRAARRRHKEGLRDATDNGRVVSKASIKKMCRKPLSAKSRAENIETEMHGVSKPPWNRTGKQTDRSKALINMVDVEETESKGRGWFATEDIPAGTQLISERPLIKLETPYSPSMEQAVWSAFRRLERDERDRFLSLSHNGKPGHDSETVHSIFENNSYEWDEQAGRIYVGVFLHASLINHNCQPNAVFDIDFVTSIGQLRSIVDIPQGTEVTINYLDDGEWISTSERQRRLLRGWNFECTCAVCSNLEREQRRRELRTLLLRDLAPQGAISSHARPKLLIDDEDFNEESQDLTLSSAFRYIEVLEKEGIVDERKARAHNIAARLLVRAERLEEALEQLCAAQRINFVCFGEGSEFILVQARKIGEVKNMLK